MKAANQNAPIRPVLIVGTVEDERVEWLPASAHDRILVYSADSYADGVWVGQSSVGAESEPLFAPPTE